MRIDNVVYYKGKKSVHGFLGANNEIITFTKNAGKFDDGSSRSVYKKTFLEKMFNKGAQKVVETVDSEEELFQLERAKIMNAVVTAVPPVKVAGTIQYSSTMSFECDGQSYMLGYTSSEEVKLKEFEDLFI